MKRNTHKLNVKLIAIMQTAYGIARADAEGVSTRPAKWGKQMQERANELANRVLREVVFPAIRPYEKVIEIYAIFHLPNCATWQEGDCSCGLDDVRRTLKANQLLMEKEG